jgi:hypothetical protein
MHSNLMHALRRFITGTDVTLTVDNSITEPNQQVTISWKTKVPEYAETHSWICVYPEQEKSPWNHIIHKLDHSLNGSFVVQLSTTGKWKVSFFNMKSLKSPKETITITVKQIAKRIYVELKKIGATKSYRVVCPDSLAELKSIAQQKFAVHVTELYDQYGDKIIDTSCLEQDEVIVIYDGTPTETVSQHTLRITGANEVYTHVLRPATITDLKRLALLHFGLHFTSLVDGGGNQIQDIRLLTDGEKVVLK